MRPKIYWVGLPASGRLVSMPRPRSSDWLDDEIAGWRAEGIDVIVSLLQANEVEELGLQREPDLCHDVGMEFISFPLPDRGVPSKACEARALAEAIVAHVKEGKGVALRCRAGIGRSALMAACVLVLFGLTPAAAFNLIGKARGVDVPDTEGQRDWVDRLTMTIGGIHPA
ncbi:MAG: protein-tyrosine phosphatase family protein [Methylocella sp.]|nr:MAG: tyrosine protein phosphatase [Hyphomicrobiales bacterium]